MFVDLFDIQNTLKISVLFGGIQHFKSPQTNVFEWLLQVTSGLLCNIRLKPMHTYYSISYIKSPRIHDILSGYNAHSNYRYKT